MAASTADLECIAKRLEVLENALLMPDTSKPAPAVSSDARIAQLERTLQRTQYRLSHLEKAYDRLVAERSASNPRTQ